MTDGPYGLPNLLSHTATSTGIRLRHLRFDDEASPMRERRRGYISVHDEDGNDAGELGDSTDGMGAMIFTDEEDCGYFGITDRPPSMSTLCVIVFHL